MKPESLREIIGRADAGGEPRIEIIKRARIIGPRLGVFASSFNPTTVAHVELMRRAAASFSLDEMLALAGIANADKISYEASLEDRLAMLALALDDDPRATIGLSSHAFYVDMADAIRRAYTPETDLHFVVGFDTFARVLDREDQYTAKYYRKFADRAEALKYLLAHSRLIVAGRAGAGYADVRAIIESEPVLNSKRVLYLDFPDELAERSATEVRSRVSAGQAIAELVPREVERYIHKRELYK